MLISIIHSDLDHRHVGMQMPPCLYPSATSEAVDVANLPRMRPDIALRNFILATRPWSATNSKIKLQIICHVCDSIMKGMNLGKDYIRAITRTF